jgi:hypothetical protein
MPIREIWLRTVADVLKNLHPGDDEDSVFQREAAEAHIRELLAAPPAPATDKPTAAPQLDPEYTKEDAKFIPTGPNAKHLPEFQRAAPQETSADCQHEDFTASVDVNRLTRGEGGEVYAYSCDIRVKCSKCGLPFTFPGFANGISSHEARVSINGEVLCVPMKPADKLNFVFYPGFNVTHTENL